MKTTTVFCAHCQEDKTHTLSSSRDHTEIIATCECERTVKFPANITKQEFKDLVAEHKANNSGQAVVTESMQAEEDQKKQAVESLLDDIAD